MPQTGVRFTVDVDGQDAETFAVVSFHLVQSYSSLFTLDIHVASSNIRLNARDLLEQTAVLTIWQGSTPQRHIKGMTARLERGEYDGRIMHYHLRVHPLLAQQSAAKFSPFSAAGYRKHHSAPAG